ncbi:MAG: hypothetical protein JWP78_2163 [Mucilaginibacter sp.]|nr:hypothetical protein [Mucilaginibacter sp.]
MLFKIIHSRKLLINLEMNFITINFSYSKSNYTM